MKTWNAIPLIGGSLVFALLAVPICRAQQPAVLDKDGQFQISEMLRAAHDEVKKHYYDPKFQGVDWDARYQQYNVMVSKIHSMGEGFRVVSSFLGELHDSHAYFVPPERSTRLDSGYRFKLIGDASYITHVRPKTDAETKLHVGDQVVKLDGFDVNRQDFHDLRYFFNVLMPQVSEQLDLRSPSGDGRQVTVNALVRPRKQVVDLTQAGDFFDLVRRYENEDHATRSEVLESGDAAIWKLQQFNLDINEVRKGIGIARKHKTLILDLRGNGGGSVETLTFLVGLLFDRDIKICERSGKNNPKPMTAKHMGGSFDGSLIVLVDAGSASASELLARVVQLEHRGKVLGDRTAGAVMEARFYSEQLGGDNKIFFGFSVTDANLIMSDGQSLEKTGVVPDELLLPTGSDLAAGRDPVLARAADLGGVKLDPVEAGKMFTFEWTPL